jgi:hypothetical protein
LRERWRREKTRSPYKRDLHSAESKRRKNDEIEKILRMQVYWSKCLKNIPEKNSIWATLEKVLTSVRGPDHPAPAAEKLVTLSRAKFLDVDG